MVTNLSPSQHIHIIGIGGTGMSAIAKLLALQNYSVSGSDMKESRYVPPLVALGVQVYIGHASGHVLGADMVLATSAVSDTHVEIEAAIAQGIPVYRRSEFLPMFLDQYDVIGVAGTHGKTTTTAMITHVLHEIEFDPNYILGGMLATTHSNAGSGDSPYFVIEADEYGNMFHGIYPHIAVLTNIEYDHPDFFPSFDHMLESFREYVRHLGDDDLLIACVDDPIVQEIADQRKQANLPVMSYGISNHDALWRATNIQSEPEKTTFDIIHFGEYFASAEIRIPGHHNVLNALVPIIVADYLGGNRDDVVAALSTFRPTGRRFDVREVVENVIVIDDYAHHPTAIDVTLAATRQAYPNHVLWAVWQPHTYSRTKALIEDYASSFSHADHLVITDIFAAREAPLPGVNREWLQSKIEHPDVISFTHFDEITNHLLQEVQSPAVIIIMSAGDAPQIGIDYVRRRKQILALQSHIKAPLQLNQNLAKYTAARLGGNADYLHIIHDGDSLDALESLLQVAWAEEIPVTILGGGANVLISDKGIRGLVLVNHRSSVAITGTKVRVDSGTSLSTLARRCAKAGLRGMEWAIAVPGTVGGAVVNNAGAHGSDMAALIQTVDVVYPDGWVTHPASDMAYGYRHSMLKVRDDQRFYVASATIELELDDHEAIEARMQEMNTYRKTTQPPGASLGSIFKNPPGDYAGRLIEQAGLKGFNIGGVQVSPVHANFFVNTGESTASDYWQLIQHVQQVVAEKFGITLELEVELLGTWDISHTTV